jgi:hypothetical protein
MPSSKRYCVKRRHQDIWGICGKQPHPTPTTCLEFWGDVATLLCRAENRATEVIVELTAIRLRIGIR